MESPGAMSEGEWNNFNGAYSPEEADFIAQLLGNCSLPTELPATPSFGVPSTLCPSHESTTDMSATDEGLMYSSSDNTSIYSFSRGRSHSGGSTSFLFPSLSHESYSLIDSYQFLATDNSSILIDLCTGDVDKNTSSPVEVYTNILMERDDRLNGEISTDSMEEPGVNLPDDVLHGKNLQIAREPEFPLPETSAEDKESNLHENSKKRPRVSGDVQRKRVVKSKKNQEIVTTNNNVEENNAEFQRQSSSSFRSEENFNASQELNGGATSSSTSKGAASLKLNGKKRASRESAYNPQSLYARKRRERINERLRILQNLVPNGTKVDISTMLEEAVQYVKFLQLQIKLLSSDDLWMYAPIAYNGIDIGLGLKITTPR